MKIISFLTTSNSGSISLTTLVSMSFVCDKCGQSFTRKYALKVHQLNKHSKSKAMKRKYLDEEEEDSYPPLKRSNAVPDNWNPNEEESGFGREESLQRSDVTKKVLIPIAR